MEKRQEPLPLVGGGFFVGKADGREIALRGALRYRTERQGASSGVVGPLVLHSAIGDRWQPSVASVTGEHRLKLGSSHSYLELGVFRALWRVCHKLSVTKPGPGYLLLGLFI